MSSLEGLHAVGYARVSTDDKGQDTSVQADAIRKWAVANGVVIDQIIEEEVSGGEFPRPGLSNALITVRTTSASMLVCYDQSRLTRDAEHHLPLIQDLLGKSKVIRYVVNGDADPNSFGMKMLSAVKGVSDSEERRLIKEKTKLAMYKRRDIDHIHLGRPARIVITDHPEELNKGVINERTIVLSVARALNYAAQGWTVSYVAVKLLNIPPATFFRALKRADLDIEYQARYNKAVGGGSDGVL